MDEERNGTGTDNESGEAADGGQQAPFHDKPRTDVSRMEVVNDDGNIRYDSATAHQAAGDDGYKKRLPGSCAACRAAEIAEAATQTAWEELKNG